MAVDIIARALAAKALGGDGSGGSGSTSDVFEVSQLTDYEVGGIPVGTDLNGMTWQQIFYMMLYGSTVVTVPELTGPSFTVEINKEEDYYEVGSTVTLTGTITFDRGSISPAYGTSGYRSGLPTIYRVGGTEYVSSELSIEFSVEVRVQEGSNELVIEVDYAEGEQPLDSAGGLYDSPLPAGTLTQTIADVFTGAYPIYVSTTGGDFVPMEIVNQFNEDGEVIVEVPGESSTAHRQAVGFVATLPEIIGIQQYDESRDLWDWIYGTPEESLTMFNKSMQTIDLNGIPVEYRVYTNASILFGRRQLKFFIPTEGTAARVNGVDYSSVQEAIDAASNGATVRICADVELAAGEQIVINKNMTLTGEYTISSDEDQSPIKIQGEDVMVTLKDLTLSSGYSINDTSIYDTGRAITVDLSTGNVNLTLNNVTLTADGGSTDGCGSSIMIESASSTTNRATINITNSVLSSPNGHALRVYAPADITVSNCVLSGWSIAYFQASGGNSASSTLSIANSTMTSTGRTGTNNAFGAFVICTAIDNISISGGTLDVISNTNTQGLLQLDYNPGGVVTFEDITITASGDSFVIENVCESCVSDPSVVDLNFGAGTVTNFEISDEFLADGCVISENEGTYTVTQE